MLKTVANTLSFIPRGVAYFLSERIGALLFRMDRRRKNDALVNLAVAFPESSCEWRLNIVKKCYQNMLFYAFEFVKNIRLSKEEAIKKFGVDDKGIIDGLKSEGKNIIFITGHFGNWEAGPLAYSARYGEMTVIGRESGNASVDEIIRQRRERFGIELIGKHNALKKIVSSMKKGNGIAIVVDQNTAENEGILVDFFGLEARHTPVASILAKRFDAVILPVFTYKKGEGYVTEVSSPIVPDSKLGFEEDIKRLTQAQANATKEAILKEPSEYFWFHRRWKNRYEEIYGVNSPCLGNT